MPLVEVDEAELGKFRTAYALVEKLGQGKTRGRLLGLIKEAQPNAVIPEVDAAAEVMEEIRKRDERLAKLEKDAEDDRAARAKERDTATLDGNIAKGRKMLIDAGYTDEGIAGVEKIMTERGITDYEAAAALFDREQPKAEPIAGTSYSGNRWDWTRPAEDDKTGQNWLKDPIGQSQREVQGWLADQRGPIRRRA